MSRERVYGYPPARGAALLLQEEPELLRDLGEGRVVARPARDRDPVARQHDLDLGEGRVLEGVVVGAEQDRDHLGPLGAEPLERPPQLDVVEVVGGEEIRAHEEQDHLGLFEVAIDRAAPLFAGADPAGAPAAHVALALQQREVRLQLPPKLFVLGGVTEENVDRSSLGHGVVRGGATKIVTKSLRGGGLSRPPPGH